MSSRLDSLNGAIDQLVVRRAKDAGPNAAVQARPDSTRAEHVAMPEWPLRPGVSDRGVRPKPELYALAVAEHALADIAGALGPRYGEGDTKPGVLGARLGSAMSARQLVEAVLGLGASVASDREVIGNLRDKLHLSPEDARVLVETMAHVAHEGVGANRNVVAGLEARAAVIGQSATRLASCRRGVHGAAASLGGLAMSPTAKGAAAMVAAFGDLLTPPRTGER